MIDKDLIIQLQQEQLALQADLISGLNEMVKLREEHNAVLEARIKVLEERIVVLENNQKKDSTNSSKPPSTDIAKAPHTSSLRTKSDKPPGGQQGHIGETLHFRATPDEVVVHAVKQCGCCGKSLAHSPVVDYERRQVYDIPPISMQVTEHRSERRSCAHCHTLNKAVFPQSVSQAVQYGTTVQQLAVYFTQYQLLPYQRTSEIFKDLFGHGLSSSFLVNTNQRCATMLLPFIRDLKTKLLSEPVLHADETGFYFEGRRNWLHSISTEKHSWYAPHLKRGREAMEQMEILPAYEGVLVHDFWKPYNEYGCSHALCNVHHLRDLTFCHQVEESSWAGGCKELLLDVYAKVKRAKEGGATALSRGQWRYWSEKYDRLMAEGVELHPVAEKEAGKRGVVKKSKTQNMLARFVAYKDEILAFAKNFAIPFGNNVAEQAIRMMKVKQKVSGCFRSEQGAKDFATIRSYIATMKKQGMPILQALAAAINGNPFFSSA